MSELDPDLKSILALWEILRKFGLSIATLKTAKNWRGLYARAKNSF